MPETLLADELGYWRGVRAAQVKAEYAKIIDHKKAAEIQGAETDHH